jgi:hypothetical protein
MPWDPVLHMVLLGSVNTLPNQTEKTFLSEIPHACRYVCVFQLSGILRQGRQSWSMENTLFFQIEQARGSQIFEELEEVLSHSVLFGPTQKTLPKR